MQRALFEELVVWKTRKPYFPLLLRGARQVGKTYLVRQFAKTAFSEFVEINFERQPEYKSCFETLNPKEIVNAIALLSGKTIIPGQTLVFFDEIQACPLAIVALRYFKEEMEALHVIGAGSLLEFAIHNEDISMPVGRVQYLYMKALSFQEFLTATQNSNLLDYIKKVDLKSIIPEVIHQQLLKLMRQYMLTGGMPMIVDTFVQRQDIAECQRQQSMIINTYRDDFGKYAKHTQHKYLESVFEKSAGLIGQSIKYATIDPDSRSRDLKEAIKNLSYSGIVSQVFCTSAAGIPLNSFINEKKFKLIYLDIGLAKRSAKLDLELMMKNDILLVNRGMLAEQLVGQELLAYQNPFEKSEVYYWHREQKNSKAEVDYVVSVGQQVIPIEVKAGTTGRLKSLHVFMEDRDSPVGIRISEKKLGMDKQILSLPFYLIGELERLVLQV